MEAQLRIELSKHETKLSKLVVNTEDYQVNSDNSVTFQLKKGFINTRTGLPQITAIDSLGYVRELMQCQWIH